MKLFLYPNDSTEARRQAAVRCTERLATHFACYASAAHAAWLHADSCGVAAPEDCDLIVAFGGDGTVLRAAAVALEADKPLIGVNTGRLGYLCALGEGDLAGLDAAALAKYRPGKRSLIEFELNGRTCRALNELMIAKSDFGTTLDVHAELAHGRRENWQGDGLLVATPTGSTAYNLSAGGPLLQPECGCFVLTPLCPVDRRNISIVYSDREALTVTATCRSAQQAARLYADGIFLGILEGALMVRCAAQTLTLLERENT